MNDKQYPQRTLRQSRALHKLFSLLAEELNNNNLDMRKTLKPSIQIPWSGASVKEYLWRPIQKAQVAKDSTTQLNTKEIDEVFDTINRHLGDTFGISMNFPSIDDVLYDMQAKEKS